MNKLFSRIKSNWSACCSGLMKMKATRSSCIESYRTKTNLAIERCERRLALDASQVPEGQPIDEGFLEVIQPASTGAISLDAGLVANPGGFVSSGFINYRDFIFDSGSMNANIAPDSIDLRPQTNGRMEYALAPTTNGFSNAKTALRNSVLDVAINTLDAASLYSYLVYDAQESFYNNVTITGTNDGAAKSHLGMTAEFAAGEISILTFEEASNGSVQDSVNAFAQFEPTEISSVSGKWPKSFREGSSLTTSFSKHHHTDPAVLHVSSLQTISFESAKPVFHADQAFTVLASNDGTQVAMPQSQMARGEPSSTGFLDMQATIAGIDSAQKTLFDAVVFDTENGSSLFEENALHGDTNSMPVMARATLFEVAEHRVHSSPREVLRGHDGHEKATDGGKTVAIPTLPHDTLVASGDSDNWASSDLSLYVRLSLAAAFATTTFELDKKYRSTDSSTNNANDTNAKQKRVLR